MWIVTPVCQADTDYLPVYTEDRSGPQVSIAFASHLSSAPALQEGERETSLMVQWLGIFIQYRGRGFDPRSGN